AWAAPLPEPSRPQDLADALDADPICAVERVRLVVGHVAPVDELAIARALGAAEDEALLDLLHVVEIEVIGEDRVLDREEGLALADGPHALLGPGVVEAVHQLVGDDEARVAVEVIEEGEQPLLAIAELVILKDGAVAASEPEPEVAKLVDLVPPLIGHLEE